MNITHGSPECDWSVKALSEAEHGAFHSYTRLVTAIARYHEKDIVSFSDVCAIASRLTLTAAIRSGVASL